MATNSPSQPETVNQPTTSQPLKDDSLRREARAFAGLLLAISVLVIGACMMLKLGLDLSRMKPRMAVTELDREQVFNEDNLKKSFPELAKNLRTNVADWIVGDHYRTVEESIWFCVVMAAGNVLIAFIMLFRFRKPWPADEAEQVSDNSV